VYPRLTTPKNVTFDYKYYQAKVDPTAGQEKKNTTALEKGTMYSNRALFTWTGPMTNTYLENNRNARSYDVKVTLSMESSLAAFKADFGGSGLQKCSIFGSTMDSFPGYDRTYEVLRETNFESGSGILELLVPIFVYSPKVVYFAIACNTQIDVGLKMGLGLYNRSALISTDEPNLQRPCPGESVAEHAGLEYVTGGTPCSAHGSCVDEGGHAPLCYCDLGYVGADCSVARFPQTPYMSIDYPGENGVISHTDAEVRIKMKGVDDMLCACLRTD